ncbi:MAG: hypothetical protein K9M55_08890 [Candidatus Marinimicrobia bacterium]|nr:hypothetical protein [Candidatus Neomarinimicrobiota bacterium]MCF7922803.1 hypothetical protein [Candidatus Neomarinimicrobiota bacterium]
MRNTLMSQHQYEFRIVPTAMGKDKRRLPNQQAENFYHIMVKIFKTGLYYRLLDKTKAVKIEWDSHGRDEEALVSHP